MNTLDYQVTLCSGSNQTHASVATIGHHCPNIKINVLTRRPADFADQIVGKTDGSNWEYKGDMIGKIHMVSDKPEDVIPGSRVIIICSPSHISATILS